jgi:hypothetical protein
MASVELILIPCSGQKKVGGMVEWPGEPTLASKLNRITWEKLCKARNKLALAIDLPPGPDLGWIAKSPAIQYLPAFERYQGRLYRGAHFAARFPSLRHKRVLIISALYGVLDPMDWIRNYDLHMKCETTRSHTVAYWWKENGLGHMVSEAIQLSGAAVVHDLLPEGYRKALSPWPPETIPFNVIEHSYEGRGMGADHDRGLDLARIMEADC